MAEVEPTGMARLTTPGALAAAGVVAFVCVAVAAAMPLAAYTLGLALFGLPHVLAEMGYVRRRFGARIPAGGWAVLLGLLAMIVALRVSVLAGVVGAATARPFELAAVAALALAVAPLAPPARRPLVLVATLTLGIAALAAPLLTLLFLAVLHNLTPVAFFAEAAPPGRRLAAASLATLVFIGGPALVATGVAGDAMAALGLAAMEAAPLASGPLRAQFGAYLPPSLHGLAWAPQLFAAIVAAQLLHYAAVILALPRLLPAEPAPRVRRRGLAIAAATLPLALLFFADFGEGRAVYGIASAVHAWIEVPVLLLALAAAGGGGQRSRKSAMPSAKETAFVAADSPSATMAPLRSSSP